MSFFSITNLFISTVSFGYTDPAATFCQKFPALPICAKNG